GLGGRLDHDASTDRHRMQRSRDFDHQAAHADNTPVDGDPVELVDLFGERLHRRPARAVAMVTSLLPVLTLYLPGPLIIASSLGIKAGPPGESAWASPQSRLAPQVNLERERPRGQKSTLSQHLKAIRSNLPRDRLHEGIRFC